jgi:hypothetical protein
VSESEWADESLDELRCRMSAFNRDTRWGGTLGRCFANPQDPGEAGGAEERFSTEPLFPSS